jgi:putative hemolysin
MTPRVHVAVVGLEDDYASVIAAFKENTYSRMPVAKGGTDEIVGVLNIKDIAFASASGQRPEDFSVAAFLRQPHFVYEFNNVAKVFNEMRKDRIPMSVVLDEYGVMAGVITMEDFVEEIVGDINDEYDDESERPVSKVGDNEFVVDGTMGVEDFNDTVGTHIETDDFDSIGGFVLGLLEDFPEEGDVASFENVKFAVECVMNNRIETLRVTIEPPQEEGEGEGEGAGPGAAQVQQAGAHAQADGGGEGAPSSGGGGLGGGGANGNGRGNGNGKGHGGGERDGAGRPGAVSSV